MARPYANEGAEPPRRSLAAAVCWLPGHRALVEWLNGDRIVVDRHAGAGPLVSTGTRSLHVFSCGPNRAQVFSIDAMYLRKLDPETLAPATTVEHFVRGFDVRAVPSPSGSRIMLLASPSRVAVVNAATLAVEREHRTEGDLHCADWLDDDSVVVAHSSGVDTLLLAVPL